MILIFKAPSTFFSVSNWTDSFPCSTSKITVFPTPASLANSVWLSPLKRRWHRTILFISVFIYRYNGKTDHIDPYFHHFCHNVNLFTANTAILMYLYVDIDNSVVILANITALPVNTI